MLYSAWQTFRNKNTFEFPFRKIRLETLVKYENITDHFLVNPETMKRIPNFLGQFLLVIGVYYNDNENKVC